MNINNFLNPGYSEKFEGFDYYSLGPARKQISNVAKQENKDKEKIVKESVSKRKVSSPVEQFQFDFWTIRFTNTTNY